MPMEVLFIFLSLANILCSNENEPFYYEGFGFKTELQKTKFKDFYLNGKKISDALPPYKFKGIFEFNKDEDVFKKLNHNLLDFLSSRSNNKIIWKIEEIKFKSQVFETMFFLYVNKNLNDIKEVDKNEYDKFIEYYGDEINSINTFELIDSYLSFFFQYYEVDFKAYVTDYYIKYNIEHCTIEYNESNLPYFEKIISKIYTEKFNATVNTIFTELIIKRNIIFYYKNSFIYDIFLFDKNNLEESLKFIFFQCDNVYEHYKKIRSKTLIISQKYIQNYLYLAKKNSLEFLNLSKQNMDEVVKFCKPYICNIDQKYDIINKSYSVLCYEINNVTFYQHLKLLTVIIDIELFIIDEFYDKEYIWILNNAKIDSLNQNQLFKKLLINSYIILNTDRNLYFLDDNVIISKNIMERKFKSEFLTNFLTATEIKEKEKEINIKKNKQKKMEQKKINEQKKMEQKKINEQKKREQTMQKKITERKNHNIKVKMVKEKIDQENNTNNLTTSDLEFKVLMDEGRRLDRERNERKEQRTNK